ncbi:MAG: hypothetical protein HY238_19450 [Acidobacteria bacterium]|nr:hypothetical protein [Acidobacteriota bacterium]
MSSLAASPRVCAATRRPSLVYSSLCGLAGTAAYAASQWGMVVVLARLGDPVLVGHCAVAVALTAPPLMLSNLQLRQVVAADAEGRWRRAACWKLRLAATSGTLGIVALLAGGAGLMVARTLRRRLA